MILWEEAPKLIEVETSLDTRIRNFEKQNCDYCERYEECIMNADPCREYFIEAYDVDEIDF